MGPGMMHRGYGPGMMEYGYGWGAGQQYGQRYAPYSKRYQTPLEEKDARDILENYLKATGNPNLKLGKIEEKNAVFEAEVLTKDGSLVDTILVNKETGWMKPGY